MNAEARVSMLESLDLSRAMTIDHIGAEDQFQYCLCCKTWFYVVTSFASPQIASQLETVVNSVGLFTALKSADTAAEAMLSGEFNSPVYERDSLFGLWVKICEEVSMHVLDDVPWMAIATGLVLRFPKRFTITSTEATNIGDFIECQNRAHILNVDWSARPGETILTMVAKNIEKILHFEDDYIENNFDCWLSGTGLWQFHLPDSPFSDGACYYPNLGLGKTSRISAYKYHFVCACGHQDRLLRSILGEDWTSILALVSDRWPTEKLCQHKYASILSAVPKNYKERRMIAPETPLLNFYARRAREVIFWLTETNGFDIVMNPHDQSINRELARLGSLFSGHPIKGNAFCTIDMRHASDSIPRSLFFEALRFVHPFIRRVIRFGLADEIVYNDKFHYTPQILATSGSPLTPILQSIWYLAIIMTAYDLCGIKYETVLDNLNKRSAHLHSHDIATIRKLPFAVYNDDIVVKQEAFQTVVEMLERFGLTINVSKTFSGTNSYRESCGGEFVAGYDITGCYWPRKAIETKKDGKLKAESVMTLVSLQHKLLTHGAWAASDYLVRIIRNMVPSMTMSAIYTDSNDLWVEWRSPLEDATQPHCNLVPTYTNSKPSKDLQFGADLLKAISYYRFLSEGPSYASDLDRTLGVSTRDDSYEHCTARPSETLEVSKPSVRDCW